MKQAEFLKSVRSSTAGTCNNKSELNFFQPEFQLLLVKKRFVKLNLSRVYNIFKREHSAMADAGKPLGIVVVGLGRAGQSRVRDLKQKVLGETAVLRGIISR